MLLLISDFVSICSVFSLCCSHFPSLSLHVILILLCASFNPGCPIMQIAHLHFDRAPPPLFTSLFVIQIISPRFLPFSAGSQLPHPHAVLKTWGSAPVLPQPSACWGMPKPRGRGLEKRISLCLLPQWPRREKCVFLHGHPHPCLQVQRGAQSQEAELGTLPWAK